MASKHVRAAAAVSVVVVGLLGLGAVIALSMSAGAGGPAPRIIAIELQDSYVVPKRIEVAPGEQVDLFVRNVGLLPHDLVLPDGTGTRMLDPGQSQTIRIGPLEEPAWLWCTVPGHKEAGMALRVVLAEATPEADD